MDYYYITKKSLKNIVMWPQLLLPNIFYSFIQIISTSLLFTSKNVRNLFNLSNLEQSLRDEVANQLTGLTLLQVILSFIIFAVFTFFLTVGIDAVKFNMMSQVVVDKRCSLRKAWRERYKNYFRLGLLKLTIYLLTITMAAIVASPLVVFETSGFKYLGLLIAIIAALFIKISILFSAQYMFLKREGPMHAFGNSIIHLFKKPLHSLGSWGVLTGLEIFSAVIGIILYNVLGGGVLGTVIISLIYILYKVWSEMFLFESLNATLKQ